MELRHLRYFCAVAEHRSFTVAARQLNVSQSGVSGQVRDLEKEIGVTFLHRGKREVALTPEGLAFFHEAREILMRSERAVDIAMRASKGQSGRLTVGLCGPVTASCLPKAIRTFRKQFPGVALSLREHAPAEQVDALLRPDDVGEGENGKFVIAAACQQFHAGAGRQIEFRLQAPILARMVLPWE